VAVQFLLGCGRILAEQRLQILDAVFDEPSYFFDLSLD